jgi:polyferredoxin
MTDGISLCLPNAVPRQPWLVRLGLAMAHHRRWIQAIQWAVVVFYLGLVSVPAFLPLPPTDAHIYNNLVLFAQLLFWGIWWPFVILSMFLLGRVWCGVFCPEGALSEWASRRGLGRAVPRWMKWGGWPFVAFVLTTLYGQLVSVYEYPQAALLVLGGSTVAAIAVGLVYGRGKRVWCRHLCPVNGVFSLLARLSPLRFKVDRAVWDRAPPSTPVDCAPLIDIRRMTGASECHMCGRCAGHRNAVELSTRLPGSEVVAQPPQVVRVWEARLLVFGMLGVAFGAFQWTASPWLVALKQSVAEWLVVHDSFWLLQDSAPWWLLTHYPQANDTFTWLDGLLLLGYIGAQALLVGGWIWGGLHVAGRLLPGKGRDNALRLAYALIPLAGFSLFVGLSLLTTGQLQGERIVLPWAAPARMVLLMVGVGWSLLLAKGMVQTLSLRRQVALGGLLLLAMLPVPLLWGVQFFLW